MECLVTIFEQPWQRRFCSCLLGCDAV